MRQELKVSVVIPLYNKEGTIRRCISSIQAQEMQELEIIVVDDGSTDASFNEVSSIVDDRIIVIQQENAGPGRARNVGASSAQGALIAFLDGDDEWQSSFLKTGVNALDLHPEAVAYCCGYDAGDFGHLIKNRVAMITDVATLSSPPRSSIGEERMMDHLDALHSSSTIVRRKAFEATSGFYDRERCLWGEDSYFWSQILFSGPIFWDPTARTYYHVENSALGVSVTRRDRARPLAEFSDEISQTLSAEHDAAFRILTRAVASGDAAVLADSGYFVQSLTLRIKHRALNITDIARDALRYLRCRIKLFCLRGAIMIK